MSFVEQGKMNLRGNHCNNLDLTRLFFGAIFFPKLMSKPDTKHRPENTPSAWEMVFKSLSWHPKTLQNSPCVHREKCFGKLSVLSPEQNRWCKTWLNQIVKAVIKIAAKTRHVARLKILTYVKFQRWVGMSHARAVMARSSKNAAAVACRVCL